MSQCKYVFVRGSKLHAKGSRCSGKARPGTVLCSAHRDKQLPEDIYRQKIIFNVMMAVRGIKNIIQKAALYGIKTTAGVVTLNPVALAIIQKTAPTKLGFRVDRYDCNTCIITVTRLVN